MEKNKKKFYKKWWFWVIVSFVGLLLIYGNYILIYKDNPTSSPQKNKNVIPESISKKLESVVGEFNKIYNVDPQYSLPNGNENTINIQSVKKYSYYKMADGTKIENVIVIENDSSNDNNVYFVKHEALFAAYDKDGNIIDLGTPKTQTGEEYSEIIFIVGIKDYVKCEYIQILGVDKSKYGSSALLFQVN